MRRGRVGERVVELGVDLLTMYRYVCTLYMEARVLHVLLERRLSAGYMRPTHCRRTRLSRKRIMAVLGAMHSLVS